MGWNKQQPVDMGGEVCRYFGWPKWLFPLSPPGSQISIWWTPTPSKKSIYIIQTFCSNSKQRIPPNTLGQDDPQILFCPGKNPHHTPHNINWLQLYRNRGIINISLCTWALEIFVHSMMPWKHSIVICNIGNRTSVIVIYYWGSGSMLDIQNVKNCYVTPQT